MLEPSLEAVPLKLRDVLERADKPIRHVYFPEDGLASVVTAGPEDIRIEAGIIGREGMSGIPLILGDDRSLNSTVMQVAGHGFRMKADEFRVAMGKSATLRKILLRFVEAFMIQVAYTAAANGRGRVEERLARWVLMAHDRLSGNELALTHELLATMLGVRRPGITVALKLLKNRGLVSTGRGVVIVRDRAGLEAFAGEFYGIPEAHYRRLTGWKARS